MKKLVALFLLFMVLNTEVFALVGNEPEATLHNDSESKQAWLSSKGSEFMTLEDRLSSTLSNIRIQNIGSAVTVTAIYIYTLSSNPTDCTSSTLLESEANPCGALWAPKVTMANNEIKYIGANYLYNMMALFLYQAKVQGATSSNLTPGANPWCLWLGITNQQVGTGNLTSSTGTLETANQLVQFILPADAPISFTNITCDDSTRLCTSDATGPQPFPHQQP